MSEEFSASYFLDNNFSRQQKEEEEAPAWLSVEETGGFRGAPYMLARDFEEFPALEIAASNIGRNLICQRKKQEASCMTDFPSLEYLASQQPEDRKRIELHSRNSGDVELLLQRKRLTDLWELVDEMVELEVRICGYVRRNRAKLDFMIFDRSGSTVRCVFPLSEETKEGPRIFGFFEQLSRNSIVHVIGVVSLPKARRLTQTTQQVEIQVRKVIGIDKIMTVLPPNVEDAARIEAMERRVKQAILAIQFQVEHAFREFLTSKRFIGIHTPVLMAGSSEGSPATAFLAPQIHKQMAICGGFSRVFEVGTCFKAEDFSEFIGLDVEMQILNHYSEIMDLLDELFVSIFTHLNDKCKIELETVGTLYPFKPLKFLPKTLKLTFAEGVQMLKEAGVEVDPLQDLNAESKRILGQLILEKYNTEFYILHRCHLAGRPFYTMPCADDSTYSNSFDVFIRGVEIVSGAQHIHDAILLEKRAKECGIDVETMSTYIDSFRYGTPLHGGFGAGLEAVVMFFLFPSIAIEGMDDPRVEI